VFVAVEFGLVAVDRARIEQLADGGDRRARVTRRLLSRLPFALGGAQLGISLVSLIIGFLAEPVVARALEPVLAPFAGERAGFALSVALALAIATVAQLVLGELIPKGLTIAHPEAATLHLARPLSVFTRVFKPVIWLLNTVATKIVRGLGIEPLEELSHVRSLPELALLFQASAEEGTLAGSASTLLHRSVRFGQKTAADVLVPRLEVKAIPRDATVAELVALAAATGFSRFPVYGADLDDIVGVVLVRSVHGLPLDAREETPVDELMTEAVALPESRQLEHVLLDMRWSRNHLVIVVDEYGGTAGILTLEDVLEEIVGEIDDEYDLLTPRLNVEESAGVFLLSGALHPDEVHESVGFALPEGEYETLAGFILDELGRIPEVGERFVFRGWTFEVAEMDRRRVATVRISVPEPVADEDVAIPRPPGYQAGRAADEAGSR
jgi:CBS domain containing-hemolysin-like protein